jgi:hypothetical protein
MEKMPRSNLSPDQNDSKNQVFRPLIFSFETFLPIKYSNHIKCWRPLGVFLWWYWFQVIMGWTINSFLAIWLAHLIR